MRMLSDCSGLLAALAPVTLFAIAFTAACSGAQYSDLTCVDGVCSSTDGTDPDGGTSREGGKVNGFTDDAGKVQQSDGGTIIGDQDGGVVVNPTPCSQDKECTNGLCNWKTMVCSAPAPNGAACSRDEECAGGTCNWKLSQCAAPAANGDPCSRDQECTSNLCNWKTSQCSDPGALGDPCSRDQECQGNLCNWKTNKCAEKGVAGGPCSRNQECQSNVCNTQTSKCQ